MSLLQDVLRSSVVAEADKTQTSPPRSEVDDDEEYVNVVSLPGTPARTRPPSPNRVGAATRPAPGPLHLSCNGRDPLKVFPTEVSQRVFRQLSVKQLCKCALVSKKWKRSQTINYVWYQLYRKENYHDDSLPQGKWTRRESKENWRLMYLQSENHSPRGSGNFSISSGYASPHSGYQTPREIREEKWRQEAELTSNVTKNEMRAMYKELGGRKPKSKGKFGGGRGARDKGGWDGGDF
ncbi:hypothetical protein FISHEDRAFT_37229 [Fistulina hepatica ATCC 64428]|uniref:F-box domain-containing protein n=1 Tax=Fistulina hepatica ATCC 64428 TaxID=1128425 RepID=A0A0D7AHY4_9AGAR|nr:hypothetical protein FISHEDRAFT_37229 [Fistulina hepatica ATCC 64428]